MPNKENFPPNINPQIYAWLASVVGSLLVGDFSALEQNSIGNWLIMVGQFILTNAAQQQLIEGRLEKGNMNINSREHKSGGSYFANNGKSNQNQRDDVELLFEAVNRIQKELNDLINKQ